MLPDLFEVGAMTPGSPAEEHKLFSVTHPDVDESDVPADEDVLTFDIATGKWKAKPAAGGVTVHGLLTGLDADDHPHYALADKSRPDPWVAAADLSPRSLADLGTKAHDLLTGLTDDDHLQYARLLGRAGGQVFYGGAAHGQTLGLVSRLGAVSGILTLQEASPQLALTGDLDVSGYAAIVAGVAPGISTVMYASGTLDTFPASALNVSVIGNRAAGPQFTYGLSGGATQQGTPTTGYVYGLYFSGAHATTSPCGQLGGVFIQQQSGVTGTGAIAQARAFYAAAGYWGGAKPSFTYGLDIEEQGHASVGTAYGIKIDDQTATTVRLLELGPAVPYMRLVGGGDPAAGDTNLYLKVGGTLMQVYVVSNYLRVK